jgi:hypothetical protein
MTAVTLQPVEPDRLVGALRQSLGAVDQVGISVPWRTATPFRPASSSTNQENRRGACQLCPPLGHNARGTALAQALAAADGNIPALTRSLRATARLAGGKP